MRQIGKQFWRWTRALAMLSIGAYGAVQLNQTFQAADLSALTVDSDTHHMQGHYVVENESDFPWTLSNARAAGGDQTIELEASSEPYTPDGSKSLDVYHCFVLDPKFARDVMVTGAEVIPGNRQIVHHAILYKVEPAQAPAVLAKDRANGGRGWDCFGGPGLTDSPEGATAGGNWLSVWVPGAGDGLFPEGIGNPMPKGSLIVMEVHYNLNNGMGTDRSKVKLSIAPEGKKLTPIASQLRFAPVEIRCPDAINTPECTRENTLRTNVERAGELAGRFLPNGLLQACRQTPQQYQKSVGDASRIVMSCDQPNPTEMTLYAIGGHMHLLAKSIKIELNPGTQNARTLLHIPRWDFHWQGNYWFKNPVQVKRGDVIRTTCVFDNSVANQPVIGGVQTKPKYVMWAESTTDEMCLGIMMANLKP
jgi:hypothetical protein